MSDMIDMYRDIRDHERALRQAYGQPCPECTRLQPKRQATILLPGHRCRVDKYRDPRPRLTEQQYIDPWASLEAEASK